MSPQFAPRGCRPREHLVTAGRLYPGAWRAADSMRAQRGVGQMPTWPDWCYLPIAATMAIVADDAGIDVMQLGQLYPDRVPDAARLAGLCAWRMTQGIYRFEPAVYDAVRSTAVGGDIPHDVLYRLPEWCIYIETPDMQFGGQPLHGTLAHLEHDAGTARPELRLLLDVESTRGPMLIPVPMHLGPWSLVESIARAVDLMSVHATAAGTSLPVADLRGAIRLAVEPLVSLLLYVCSQAGEVGDGRRPPPSKPAPKRVKGLWRIFPADRPTAWDVGLRMGAALRRAYQAQQTAGDAAGDPAHPSPRPHIRRAHWHGYWSGPRDQARLYTLRWLPPIAVNVSAADELPAVVRPVRE